MVDGALKAYLTTDSTREFHLASTLRQFIEIWQLEQISFGSPGHALGSPADVQRARNLVGILLCRRCWSPTTVKSESRRPPGAHTSSAIRAAAS